MGALVGRLLIGPTAGRVACGRGGGAAASDQLLSATMRSRLETKPGGSEDLCGLEFGAEKAREATTYRSGTRNREGWWCSERFR